MDNQKQACKKWVVITGGGTGGHLFPALAVVEALHNRLPDLDILFVGKDQEPDRSEVEKRHIPFQGFPLDGLRRKLSWSNVRALGRFCMALLRCWSILRHKPQGVVFGVGGYVSAPAMAAGFLAGWKVVLHEQNSIPGLVNRLMAPRCDLVCITFEETQKYWKGIPCMITGFPLRKELIQEVDRSTGSEGSHPFSILVLGGSQGARKLVEIGVKSFQGMANQGYDFRALIQTGPRNFEWASSLPLPEQVTLTPFIHDMAEAYRHADVVVSRAGSGTLSEIALWGLPAILVPYPYASENHQLVNAQCFADRQAAIVIEEAGLTPDSLGEHLAQLLQQEERRLAMGRQAMSLAKRDAASTIADQIVQRLYE